MISTSCLRLRSGGARAGPPEDPKRTVASVLSRKMSSDVKGNPNVDRTLSIKFDKSYFELQQIFVTILFPPKGSKLANGILEFQQPLQVRTAKIKITRLKETAADEQKETKYEKNSKSAFPYCIKAFFRKRGRQGEIDQFEFGSDKLELLPDLDVNNLGPFLREWLKIVLNLQTYQDERPDIPEILEWENSNLTLVITPNEGITFN